MQTFSQITVAFLSSRIQETGQKSTFLFCFISVCHSDAHQQAGKCSCLSQVSVALSPFHFCLFPASPGFSLLYHNNVHSTEIMFHTCQLATTHVLWVPIQITTEPNRARRHNGNTLDSDSAGFNQPKWSIFRGFHQSSRQKLGWIFITTTHLTIIHQIHIS